MDSWIVAVVDRCLITVMDKCAKCAFPRVVGGHTCIYALYIGVDVGDIDTVTHDACGDGSP